MLEACPKMHNGEILNEVKDLTQKFQERLS